MKRPRHIWIGFGFCLVVVLAAMGWTSLSAVRLDRAEAEARRHEAEARRQTAWEENVRLALWRMDSLLAPFVAQESARPYFAYGAFFPINRAYANMFNDRTGSEALAPSPLLAENPPNIRVYFQFEPDGRLTSPQVPTGPNYDLAVPQRVSDEAVRSTRLQLARVKTLVDREKLLTILPESAPESMELAMSPLVQTPEQRLANRRRQFELRQQGRGIAEFFQRNQAVISNANTAMAQNGTLNPLDDWPPFSTDVRGVLMTPLWIDGELILARRVSVSGREYVQGCLLDWPAIETSLLETVEDLLPKAGLEAVAKTPAREEARMLAALPVRLAPGKPSGGAPLPGLLAAEAGGTVSPILLSLGAAWGCVLLAAVAVAMLLLGVVRLSERRASFVTAVTHELRTPLTTFQMYAEMLAEGMVSDEQQRNRYLNTLRAEAARLTHLVENVLAYARLERGRLDGRLEAIALGQLIEQIQGRLAGRAEHAGMELVVERDDGASELAVRANVSATEQILFNLVDNASKYAAAASDKRIHLKLQRNGGAAQISLRDHGPGVSPFARRRLFHSFSKSAQEAAHTAPGVGLGLALSRRLARDMGGDLRLDENVSDGAHFVLTLAAAGRIGPEGHGEG